MIGLGNWLAWVSGIQSGTFPFELALLRMFAWHAGIFFGGIIRRCCAARLWFSGMSEEVWVSVGELVWFEVGVCRDWWIYSFPEEFSSILIIQLDCSISSIIYAIMTLFPQFLPPLYPRMPSLYHLPLSTPTTDSRPTYPSPSPPQ